MHVGLRNAVQHATSLQYYDDLIRKERKVADTRNAYRISVAYFGDLGIFGSKILNVS
jgi:hypothetical protein